MCLVPYYEVHSLRDTLSHDGYTYYTPRWYTYHTYYTYLTYFTS